MTVRLNPQVVTDDMMYEGIDIDLRTHDGRPLREHIMDRKMWGEIHRAAKTNKVLQDALERVILIYHLTEDNDGKTT